MRFFKSPLTRRLFGTLSKVGELKASFACPKAYRDEFSYSVAQLTISVGQLVHEGERLLSTIKLINRSFAACKIMIDDSIQAYTLAISAPGKSVEELIAVAIAAGDDYLARNQAQFTAHFTIPFEVIRWRDWLNTPEWRQAVQSMQMAYQQHPTLQAAIDDTAQTFLARFERTRASEAYDRYRAFNLCVRYLLEECGVMKDLWVKLDCHYEVYPSGRNRAMTATYEHYIKPVYPALLKPVALRFHRQRSESLPFNRGGGDASAQENHRQGS